ncbi:MAG: hypothetical protein H7Z73_04050 [Candidatus Saccharibacteria bacterium]|nr:hypothetical protein [Moraxellaceae bacterium]
MRVIFLRSILVLILSTLAHSSYAEQNVQTQVIELINQGGSDDFLGNYPKAVSSFRKALMLQLSNPVFDDEQIFETFNKYGESYSRIGLFSIVKDQDQDKDEALLRLLVTHSLAEPNINMAQMVHGLLLFFGERKFGIQSKGIQYSYLRADPLKPTCTLENPIPRIASVNDIGKLDSCQQKRAFFQLVNPAITPEVKAYRNFEIDFFDRAMRPSL